MTLVCAVSFSRHGRLHYFDPGPYVRAVGDRVLVPTDGGTEVAECGWATQSVHEQGLAMKIVAVDVLDRAGQVTVLEFSQRLRAGDPADGQGPGLAAQPAADLRCLRQVASAA